MFGSRSGDGVQNVVPVFGIVLELFDGALPGSLDRPCHGILPGMTTAPNPYRGFRFPAEVIEHAVWRYHCFSLSLRDHKTILAPCVVAISYEGIRE